MELVLLGIWYRARHSEGFRRGPERLIGENIDHVSGFEKSEAQLMPKGMAIRGAIFVLRCPYMPDELALKTLLRDPPADAPPGTPGTRLEVIRPENRTDEEVEALAEMEFRWKKCLRSFCEKGWAVAEPSVKFSSDTGHNDEYAVGLDEAGLPWTVHATPDGLDEAERRIPSEAPHLMTGAFSSLATASQEMRDAAAKESAWAEHKFRNEEGAGTF